MKIFIQAASCISPQKTFQNEGFLDQPVDYSGNRLMCIEPEYAKLIDPKLIRRMSRIIRMGTATAMDCLRQAGIQIPDAIITGTAYGCLDDTGIFLRNLVQQNETTLSPTAFIQSTHNTVGAQIALLLQCTGYNNTFVNGGTSFENALMDAILLLKEEEAATVLTGSAEEITEASFTILSRFGIYKKEPRSNFSLITSGTKGTIAGEGSAFFLLTNKASHESQVELVDIAACYQRGFEPDLFIHDFLVKNKMEAADIDLLIIGKNGDSKEDLVYSKRQESILKTVPAIYYKDLCGEYPTASSFAAWLAFTILTTQQVPAIFGLPAAEHKRPGNILVWNHYQQSSHSLMLFSKPV